MLFYSLAYGIPILTLIIILVALLIHFEICDLSDCFFYTLLAAISSYVIFVGLPIAIYSDTCDKIKYYEAMGNQEKVKDYKLDLESWKRGVYSGVSKVIECGE